MSAFLGPIHYKMYNKISLMEELIGALGNTAVRQNWRTQKQLDDDDIGKELPPLEEVIDLSNIHGSLQGMIDREESRLAALVSGLLEEDPSRLETLETAAYAFGEAHAAAPDADAEDCFNYIVGISGLLLDGMPCDRVIQVTDIGPQKTAWEQSADMHARYWSYDGRNVQNYYAIRSAVIRGMIHKAGCVLISSDKDHCEIIRQ